jgi:dTDP-4-dehydrorhamnose 3,5-epimerase
MIEGVIIKELTTHSDKRGFFREIIRKSDDFFSEGFGQWSHSLMFNGVTKAWHFHKIQTDWWYVCSGVLRVGLCDMRKDCPTYKQTMEFLMGDQQPSQVLKITPGVAHGCQTVQGPVNMLSRGQLICYILLPIHIIRMTNFEYRMMTGKSILTGWPDRQ